MREASNFCGAIFMAIQHIAAMMRSQEADPTNLEVLLALGVSHTNGKSLLE